MNQPLVLILFYVVTLASCYQPASKQKPEKKKSQFVFKETIAKDQDTVMVRLGSFKRINIADILCQRWELKNRKDITASIIPDIEMRNSIVRNVVLFKDSTVVLNPTGKIKFGTWRLVNPGNSTRLILLFPGDSTKQYTIENLTSTQLALGLPEIEHFILDFAAPAIIHKNMNYDPFHPVNNQWRIKPAVKETDSAIHARLKNCLLFYALYYRDHIKRNAQTISFEGLPRIFVWYSGGIGLPDQDELDNSWIQCFYNKQQALYAYSIIKKLIVDYEYKWPVGAPAWIYGTHSVLEQMYFKIDDLKNNKLVIN